MADPTLTFSQKYDQIVKAGDFSSWMDKEGLCLCHIQISEPFRWVFGRGATPSEAVEELWTRWKTDV